MEILIFVVVYAVFLYATFKLAKLKNREPSGVDVSSFNNFTFNSTYNISYYANFTS